MFVPLLLETPKSAPLPVSDKNFPRKGTRSLHKTKNFPKKKNKLFATTGKT
jgi:hypothetical protein